MAAQREATDLRDPCTEVAAVVTTARVTGACTTSALVRVSPSWVVARSVDTLAAVVEAAAP
ncbi:hypothetical protein F444_02985 [Phytophthora nicotianae P1976]|uniref:Uncharacterized protein n=1 Tax=Phytophthora nicotianae P1976 TaxID=1317066 RepID=A0A081AVM0_PHYNI|nr:hypothetical protein F444_02985 [Phytophthora nicotianae P1976]